MRSRRAVIGLRCKDGVVLGAEQPVVSKLHVGAGGGGRRLHTVDVGMGVAVSGVLPDGRQIANRAAAEASNYKSFYGEAMPGHVMCDRLAAFSHLFTLYWHLRPMGTCALLAAYDKNGPQLYQVDPSGVSHRFFGTATGKGKQQAKTQIEKLNLEELTCREAVKEIARIIHTVHDEAKDKPFELEMSWVCDETERRHERVPRDLVREADEAAKRALEEADMSD